MMMVMNRQQASQQHVTSSPANRTISTSIASSTSAGTSAKKDSSCISIPSGSLLDASGKPRWQCIVCNKSLSSKRSFDEHMNIHNQTRPFSCEHCDYAAASQMTLRRHKLRNHTPRRDWGYKCPYCVEAYMEPASYQQHVISRHMGLSATFGCPHTMCTFLSKCSRHFREHLNKHHLATRPSSMKRAAPYNIPDESLQKYLVDDEYGYGFGKRPAVKVANAQQLQPTQQAQQPRPITVRHSLNKTDLSVGGVDEEEFMKAPLRLRGERAGQLDTGLPHGSFVHAVHLHQHNARTRHVVLQPPRELLSSGRSGTTSGRGFSSSSSALSSGAELLPADSDWIEAEIEVGSAEVQRLPDGQIDLELD